YSYFEQKVGIEKALTRIRRYQITLYPNVNGSISLADLINRLDKILQDPCLILSFLSRKQVIWYAADADFISNTDTQDNRQATAYWERRAISDLEDQIELDGFRLPVKQRSLIEGVFQILLSTYQNSIFKDTIQQIIFYLVASY